MILAALLVTAFQVDVDIRVDITQSSVPHDLPEIILLCDLVHHYCNLL